MRKEQFVREFASRLARLGPPGAQLTREISDHWDDLEHEARDAGLTPDQAVEFASDRIGTLDALVSAHAQAMRNAQWCGRHPIISFALLPPLALLVWFLGWGLMAAGAGELYGKLLGFQPTVWSTFFLVLITAKIIHYTGLLAIPALFSWLARRSFCGSRWSWIACGVCAAHGLINHVKVHAHSLQWGYGIAIPELMPIIAPLLVATAAHFSHKLNWQLVAAVAMMFLTGCASSKPMQERGWIGGEYKAVRPSAGMLVTRLQTNSPAARSGLREGDLIVQVGGQAVNDSRQFWQAVDKAKPGKTLTMTVLRDDKTIQQDVLVGREVFKPNRSIVVGLLFAHEFDPWPDPDFSLVALGFKQQRQRVELDSPEGRFNRAHDGDQALHSREGWEVWLPIVSFSSRKSIVSQTE